MPASASPSKPALKAFFAIRDAHPLGYDHLPALALLYDEVTVWKPSFEAFEKGYAGPCPSEALRDFFKLFEDDALKIKAAYDEHWDDENFRRELAARTERHGGDPLFVRWNDEYDSRLKSISVGKVLSFDARKLDDEWAERIMADGRDPIHKTVASAIAGRSPDSLPIPVATRRRIQERQRRDRVWSDFEYAMFQCLRDARMLQRVMASTGSHSAIHRDPHETEFFNEIAPWSPTPVESGSSLTEADRISATSDLLEALRKYARFRGIEQLRLIKKDNNIKKLVHALRSDFVRSIDHELRSEIADANKRFRSPTRAVVGQVNTAGKALALIYSLLLSMHWSAGADWSAMIAVAEAAVGTTAWKIVSSGATIDFFLTWLGTRKPVEGRLRLASLLHIGDVRITLDDLREVEHSSRPVP